MVRRTAALFALVVAAATVLVLGATTSPAGATDSGPVIAGTFQGRLTMTKTDRDMAQWGAKSGPRTLSFGQGCATAQGCTASFTSSGKTRSQPVTGSAGGLGWSSHDQVGCVERVTGVLKTHHGWDYDVRVQLHPTATATRNGVTYVTALSGTLVDSLKRTGAGAGFNCLLDPDRVPNASERGVYTFTLVPLAAPTTTTSTPPLAVTPSSPTTSSTIPGFRLPQSARQRASSLAVATGHRSSVPGALVEPTDALKSVGSRLPQDLLLVALLGLLIVFPAQLFNSTYEENHERIDRRLATLRLRRRRSVAEGVAAPPSRARRLSVFLGCVVVGTLMAGLLDPKFGATTASYALVTGVFVSVLVTVLVVVLAGRVYRSMSHHESGWYLEAIPSALLVAALCVLVSRLTHFQPGYLYGVLGGAVFVAALDRRSEGRAEVTASVVALVLALVAWVVFEPVAHAATRASAGYPVLALDSLLACLFIGGLEGMLFGLVPLRFLPGARIKNWSWVAWAVLAAVVGYLFVHVLLMPESGYLGRSTTASVTTTIVLFVAFGLASVLFWGYFRWRPTAEAPPEGPPSAGEPAEAPVPDDEAAPPDEPGADAPVPEPVPAPAMATGRVAEDPS